MRADSYGQPPVPNDFFISKGRTPWAYRACGAGVIPGDRDLPYPRICAHRGFNYVAPENSLPAFGAASRWARWKSSWTCGRRRTAS